MIQDILQETEKVQKYLTVAVVFFGLTLWARWVIRNSKKVKVRGTKDIPTPEGEYFFLGHLPLIGRRFASKITEWHKELGPMFRIRIGVKDWLFIGDPHIAHDIFITKGKLSSGRPFFNFSRNIHAEGYRGLVFIDNNKRWKAARRTFSSIVSVQKVDALHEIAQKNNQEVTARLIEDCFKKPQKEISPTKYCRLSSISFILCIFFGIPNVLSVEDPLFQTLDYITQEHVNYSKITKDIGSYFPLHSFLELFFKNEKKGRNFIKNEEEPVYRDMIKRALEGDQPCFIKDFYSMKDELHFDEKDILVLAKEFLMSATDTLSLSKSFAFAILCHHPEWQQKISQEIRAFLDIHRRMPAYKDHKSIPIVSAVVKEIFRFRPSTYFGVPRRAIDDIVYGDYIIPKDTTLVFNSHTTNNSKLIFEEPEKFDPERYMNEKRTIQAINNGSIDERTHFTFGWGRRICPGTYMAESEMFTWLSELCLNYSIEPTISSTGEKVFPDIENVRTRGIMVEPMPYKIKLVKRNT
ncbi:cytochrome P450 [Sporodiniella umbellata]|nr:cytochrome P450 [Sporodiniella umbellata]